MLSFIHDSKRIQLSYHIQCSVPSSFQLLHITSNVVGCFLEALSICSSSWLGWCWVSCGVWLHAPSMRILNNWLNKITKIHSIMIGLIKSLFLYLWPSIFFSVEIISCLSKLLLSLSVLIPFVESWYLKLSRLYSKQVWQKETHWHDLWDPPVMGRGPRGLLKKKKTRIKVEKKMQKDIRNRRGWVIHSCYRVLKSECQSKHGFTQIWNSSDLHCRKTKHPSPSMK